MAHPDKGKPVDSPQLDELGAYLKDVFGRTADFVTLRLRVGTEEGLLCYLQTMTRSDFIAEQVVKPLALVNGTGDTNIRSLKELQQRSWPGLSGELVDDRSRVIPKLICGYACLTVEGWNGHLMLNVKMLESRSVEEPTTQTVIRGPKEGFTESAQTNMSLIRRRLYNEKLRFRQYTVGSKSATDIYVVYLDGEVDSRVLREIHKRLNRTEVDGMFDSGTLEELIRPGGVALFPTIYSSERPDTICAFLMEGKAAIIVNGSPFVLTVPALMNDFMKSPEDHYQWFVFGTFSRLLRYLALLISLFLSSLYIAITTYHHELIPTVLLVSIATQREGIPFPTVVEVLLMETVFELLREAGIRMPRVVGQAISIVGALVLGQAAVQAGIVSDILVIIVAMSGISSFVTPVYTFGARIRLLRFVSIIMASLLGLFGIVMVAAFLLIHLLRLRSFGVPYFAPIAPFQVRGQRDAMLRFPIPLGRRRR